MENKIGVVETWKEIKQKEKEKMSVMTSSQQKVYKFSCFVSGLIVISGFILLLVTALASILFLIKEVLVVILQTI